MDPTKARGIILRATCAALRGDRLAQSLHVRRRVYRVEKDFDITVERRHDPANLTETGGISAESRSTRENILSECRVVKYRPPRARTLTE
jgi:hypothetical protein